MEEIHLEENYRSGETILKLAEAVIEKNPGERRPLHPNRNASRPVRLALAENERGEAVFIAREINRLAGGIGMLEASETQAQETYRSSGLSGRSPSCTVPTRKPAYWRAACEKREFPM